MNKIEKSFNWGLGAFEIVMKNKLVTTVCFLVTGIFHAINPLNSLYGDTMMLSLFLMLYAVVSLVFVISNKNEMVGKGREAAQGLVKDFVKGQKDKVSKGQELLLKNKSISEHAKESNERMDKRVAKLKEKNNKAFKPGKVLLIIFYIVLLALAVCIFLWREFFVNIAQIILGGLIIADGVSGVLTVIAAYRSGAKMKSKIFSLIISVFTVVVGVAFIILPDDAASMTYSLIGIALIIKAVSDLIVMFRNREVFSSVKESINAIKNQ